MASIPPDPTTRVWWRRLRSALSAIFTTCLIVTFALMPTYPWIAWYFLIPPALIYFLAYLPLQFLEECRPARERGQEVREAHPSGAYDSPDPTPPRYLDKPSGSVGRPMS